jgi:GT2 family glycosyltransferase
MRPAVRELPTLHDVYPTITNTYAVVVSYNSGQLVKRLCRELGEESVSLSHIVVVDNGSNPNDQQCLTELSLLGVIIHHVGYNSGFARAANLGIGCALDAGAKLVAVMNPDLRLGRGEFSKLVSALQELPDVGAIGPLQRYHRSLLRPSDGLAPPQRSSHNPVWRQVDRLEGSCILFTASALNEAGLFDEDFFLYREDDEICARIRRAGFQVIEVRNARLFHELSQSSSVDYGFRLFHSTRGLFLLARKNSTTRVRLAIEVGWALARTSRDILAAVATHVPVRTTAWSVIEGSVSGLRSRLHPVAALYT